eukprot:4609496-Prymnesium_polylepis.1
MAMHDDNGVEDEVAEGGGREEGEEASETTQGTAICGRDGCPLAAWHTGMCLPVLDAADDDSAAGDRRRSSRQRVPRKEQPVAEPAPTRKPNCRERGSRAQGTEQHATPAADGVPEKRRLRRSARSRRSPATQRDGQEPRAACSMKRCGAPIVKPCGTSPSAWTIFSAHLSPQHQYQCQRTRCPEVPTPPLTLPVQALHLEACRYWLSTRLCRWRRWCPSGRPEQRRVAAGCAQGLLLRPLLASGEAAISGTVRFCEGLSTLHSTRIRLPPFPKPERGRLPSERAPPRMQPRRRLP